MKRWRRFWMVTVPCWGYGIQARWQALGHLLRGHRLRWRTDVELWSGHTGNIECFACPDSSDGQSDVVFWARHSLPLMLAMQRVCGWLGHTERRHPQHVLRVPDDPNEPTEYEDIADKWYCYRCMADVDAGV